jgi:hypothetical protein
MKAPPEEEGGLLPRAYTMSIGFYGCDSLPACVTYGFAGMKYTEKRMACDAVMAFKFHRKDIAWHTKY